MTFADAGFPEISLFQKSSGSSSSSFSKESEGKLNTDALSFKQLTVQTLSLHLVKIRGLDHDENRFHKVSNRFLNFSFTAFKRRFFLPSLERNLLSIDDLLYFGTTR